MRLTYALLAFFVGGVLVLIFVIHLSFLYDWHQNPLFQYFSSAAFITLFAATLLLVWKIRAKEKGALEKAQAGLDLILENLPDLVWSISTDMRLLYLSPNCERILGYSAEELMAAPDAWRTIIAPEELPRLQQQVEKALQGETLQFELAYLKKSGERRLFEVFCSPVKDAAGRVIRGDGLSHDVTESRALEQQLLQAQKMDSLGQLAGGVAHDFNNLLTAIIGYAEAANLAIDSQPAKSREYLAQIPEQSQRAARLIAQLLLFSRQSKIEKKPLALAPFLKELCQVLKRTLPENIRIVADISPDTPLIEADLTQLQQVVMNLATNARDAMKEGGTLTISTAPLDVRDHMLIPRTEEIKPGKHVVLTVKDTGCGMSPEVKKRMFEPFFTTKEPGKGTGLGLSIVYGIVKQHKGVTHVYSEPGKGTEFKIYFPAIRAEAPAKPAEAAPMPRGAEKILLVEDDAGVRDITLNLLDRLGYRVSVALNGREAWDRVQRETFDLIVSDIVMPEMSGARLYRKVKETSPETPMLLISGYSVDKEVEALKKEGLEGFIQKPFLPSDFAVAVRRLLDARRPPKARAA